MGAATSEERSVDEIVARHVWVEGVVQGVGFRYATASKGRELGVHGWVRNLHDGRVEAWIEGDAAAVAAMVDWLAHGPRGAVVERRVVEVAAATGTQAFSVRGDA
jgi:acylphosphatase